MDERETLGKYLKNQRESKKISLREVAKNTRVREPILRAIEEDQFKLLPPATYVKGFLLAYAKYLKLDPDDVFVRYQSVLTEEPVTRPSAQPPRPEQEAPATPPSKSRRKILWNTRQTWVVAGVLVVSFIIFYFFSPYPSKPLLGPIHENTVIEEKPSDTPPVGATSRVQKEKPITSTPSVPEIKSFSLQLKAVEDTWVSLQVDDQSERDMILKPGEAISFQASNRIRMILGNAGGLDLILNGKALERFGKSGEVFTLLFTSQGVEVKRPVKSRLPEEGIPNSEHQRSD